MADITQPIGNNLGGALRFNFINVNDVLSIPTPVNSVVSSAVVLKPGKVWSAGSATLGTMGYSEPSELTSAGTIYKKTFIAFCPEDNAANNDLFNANRNGQYIVDCTDSNGLRKLIGSIDEPLSFSSALNTKTNIPELAGTAISFYGDGSHKSYVYDI